MAGGDPASDPRRHPGRLGESGEAPVAGSAADRAGWARRPRRPGSGRGGLKPVVDRARGELALRRLRAFQRLEVLRAIWSDIGVCADRHGWGGLLELAIESEDRLAAAMRALEQQARAADRLTDDSPEHDRFARWHRQRISELDDAGSNPPADTDPDPADDAADNPLADDSESELRGPADLAAAIGFVPPRAKDADGKRVWSAADPRTW